MDTQEQKIEEKTKLETMLSILDSEKSIIESQIATLEEVIKKLTKQHELLKERFNNHNKKVVEIISLNYEKVSDFFSIIYDYRFPKQINAEVSLKKEHTKNTPFSNISSIRLPLHGICVNGIREWKGKRYESKRIYCFDEIQPGLHNSSDVILQQEQVFIKGIVALFDSLDDLYNGKIKKQLFLVYGVSQGPFSHQDNILPIELDDIVLK